MILAPATMQKESDPKMAASKCLEEIGLDPDSYRIGHTKARRKTRLVCFPSHHFFMEVSHSAFRDGVDFPEYFQNVLGYIFFSYKVNDPELCSIYI
jgi:hypothetical protein